MAGESLHSILESWLDKPVTVVNPESYKSTALGKALSFQTYEAKVASLGSDFVRLTFEAKKQDSQLTVEQFIPFGKIKRLSNWGDEKLIHL